MPFGKPGAILRLGPRGAAWEVGQALANYAGRDRRQLRSRLSDEYDSLS